MIILKHGHKYSYIFKSDIYFVYYDSKIIFVIFNDILLLDFIKKSQRNKSCKVLIKFTLKDIILQM